VDVSLLLVEWQRLRTRRIVRVFLVIALLNIVISGVWVFLKSNRDLEAAETDRRAKVERCLEQFGPPVGGFDPGPRFCETSEVRDPRFHLTELNRIFEALSLVFTFSMWGLAASFIGAEWEAGTVGMLLTHEPRRLRVLVAKITVAAGAAMVATTILLGLLSLALMPAAIVRGTTAGTTGAWIGETAELGIRVIATSGLAAVFGFSLASAARRTSVAIGVLLLTFLFEIILDRLAPGWIKWQFTQNLARFASGASDVTGSRSIGGAGILLSIYAAGLFTLTALGFKRRDVA
jgi:ABC-type transport system involved in multi-copper enzyme maturation permease subunit